MFQRYTTKYASVEACEMAPIVDGKPSVLLTDRQVVINGVGVVDRETFFTFFRPAMEQLADGPAEPEPKKRAAKKAAAKRAATHKPAPITEPALKRHEGQSLTDQVREYIKAHGTASVQEIAAATGLTTQQVHTTCFSLRQKNEIFKRDDDHRWEYRHAA